MLFFLPILRDLPPGPQAPKPLDASMDGEGRRSFFFFLFFFSFFFLGEGSFQARFLHQAVRHSNGELVHKVVCLIFFPLADSPSSFCD